MLGAEGWRWPERTWPFLAVSLLAHIAVLTFLLPRHAATPDRATPVFDFIAITYPVEPDEPATWPSQPRIPIPARTLPPERGSEEPTASAAAAEAPVSLEPSRPVSIEAPVEPPPDLRRSDRARDADPAAGIAEPAVVAVRLQTPGAGAATVPGAAGGIEVAPAMTPPAAVPVPSSRPNLLPPRTSPPLDEARAAYGAAVRSRIVSRKVYPAAARSLGWQGRTILRFVVKPGGDVAGLAVEKSSGYVLLDRAAIALVSAASPFPDPPGGELVLSVPVVYTLSR